MAQERHDEGDVRPVPDPTVLTTQQLYREIATSEKTLLTAIKALADRLEARLDGMDKAIDLIQKSADKAPSEVDTKVGALKELFMGRFDAINMQFGERDKRFEIAAHEKAIAIDAALQAQKESAAKVEERFRDDIRTLSDLVDTKTESIRQSVETIKFFQARLGLGSGE